MCGQRKRCSKCGETKALDAFYLRSGKPIAACKDCTRAARLAYVDAHRDKVNAEQKAYREANRQVALQRCRDYRAAHLEEQRAKQRAHYAANREKNEAEKRACANRNPQKVATRLAAVAARKSGRLVAEPCLFCGATPSEAHHHDYSLPLEVTWLCRRHHGLIHRTSP